MGCTHTGHLTVRFGSVQCCFTSTETIRLIRDGEKGEEGGTEVGEEGDYIPVATLSPPE